MDIVFFGSSQFSVICLEAILKAGYRIICVVTAPDRKSGRGLRPSVTPVKEFAIMNNLSLLQPIEINSPDSIETLKRQGAGVFIVVSYGQLLSQAILDIPAKGCFNVHASLLPRYRGAAPIQWAIINGEPYTGVTVIKMVKKMDAGPILLQKKLPILPEDNLFTLEARLAPLAAKALLEGVRLVQEEAVRLLPQNEKEATFAPRLKKEDGLIKWESSARQIECLIRGCFGWPGTFTYFKGILIKLFLASAKEEVLSGRPGEIIGIEKNGIFVACGCGGIVIRELQPQGRRRMTAGEFIAGHNLKIGDKFESKP